MDVKQTFLDWTTHTIPYGKEDTYLKDLIPTYFKKDPFGNYYHIIGNNPTTLFNAHFDTVGGDKEIKHIEDGSLIKSSGDTILGADDKAGVVILLYMIEKKVPGFYLFPVGEEVGCVGSGKLSKYMLENSEKQKIKINNKIIEIDLPKDEIYKNINKVISFDRMGYTSVITHQMDQRSCSDEFAISLSKEFNKQGFNYSVDDSGVYSDSAEFADIYPECTNISVGYFAQHTNNETQDIEFLESLCDACTKVNWDNLTIYRNPKDIEYLDNYYNYWGGRGSGKKHTGYGQRHQYIYDDIEDDSPIDFMKEKEKDVKIHYFLDNEYNDYISDVSHIGDKIVDINLSGDRLAKEINLIKNMLKEFDVDYDDIFWDGLILVIEDEKIETKLSRDELIEYIPDLALENIKGYSSDNDNNEKDEEKKEEENLNK